MSYGSVRFGRLARESIFSVVPVTGWSAEQSLKCGERSATCGYGFNGLDGVISLVVFMA
ncbi:MAG: hypothetical protein ACREDR_28510 [Blastocatellia bacterium]